MPAIVLPDGYVSVVRGALLRLFLPFRRYHLVIAAATSTVWLNIYQYLKVGQARKKSGIKYPQCRLLKDVPGFSSWRFLYSVRWKGGNREVEGCADLQLRPTSVFLSVNSLFAGLTFLQVLIRTLWKHYRSLSWGENISVLLMTHRWSYRCFLAHLWPDSGDHSSPLVSCLLGSSEDSSTPSAILLENQARYVCNLLHRKKDNL